MTTARLPQNLMISNEKQLDNSAGETLLLLYLSLDARQGSGETLSAMVDTVRNLISASSSNCYDFEQRLLKSGYLDKQRKRYDSIGYTANATQEALQVAEVLQQADLLIAGYTQLAEVELARGNLAAADQVLQKAEELVRQEQFVTHLFWVVGVRVRYWLTSGELGLAKEWSKEVALLPQTWKPNQFAALLMLGQVYLALQDYEKAIELLERFQLELDRPTENSLITIEFLALYFVALHLTGKRAQSQIIAVRLFAMTEPHGYVQVYLDLGDLMRQALRGWLAASPYLKDEANFSRSYVARLQALFEQVPQSSQLSSVASLSTQPALLSLREPLSRQEQQVLQRLGSGQTYAEIAQTLCVSSNTIKTQVSSIYRKLGVNRRTEAIALAQQLHLL